MTSPVIDEKVMVDCLKEPTPTKTLQDLRRIQTGALLLMLDAHDRKVTREQFETMCGAALQLTDAVARYELACNTKAFYKDKGEMTLGDIETLMSGLNDMVCGYARQAEALAKMLQRCPSDEDKVH